MSRAICTDILHFPARVLVIQAQGTARESDADPDTILSVYSGDRAIHFCRAVASRRTVLDGRKAVSYR
jgi:hypothetical protein